MKRLHVLSSLVTHPKILSALVLIFVSTVSTPISTAFALTKADYPSNGIYFYDPDATDCAISTSAATGVVTLNANDPTLKQIFLALTRGGMTAIQASAVMGNMKQESNFNPNAGAMYIDQQGYGIVQWTYFANQSSDRERTYIAYAKSQGKAPGDLATQLSYVLYEYNSSYKARLASSAFASPTATVDAATEAWMWIYEGPSKVESINKLHEVRMPAAEKVYQDYGSLAPTTSTASSSTPTQNSGGNTCSTSSTSTTSTNKIVSTALSLALPTPAINNQQNHQSDATAAYQSAKPQYNPGADWTDCGGFVSTVMRMTGIDPNFPSSWIPSIRSYVQSQSTKYTIIHPTSASDLQPGDILLSDGHAMIYSGNSPYPAIDASLTQRVPSVQPMGTLTWMLHEPDLIAARVIQ